MRVPFVLANWGQLIQVQMQNRPWLSPVDPAEQQAEGSLGDSPAQAGQPWETPHPPLPSTLTGAQLSPGPSAAKGLRSSHYGVCLTLPSSYSFRTGLLKQPRVGAGLVLVGHTHHPRGQCSMALLLSSRRANGEAGEELLETLGMPSPQPAQPPAAFHLPFHSFNFQEGCPLEGGGSSAAGEEGDTQGHNLGCRHTFS